MSYAPCNPSDPSDPIFCIEALRAGEGQCLLVHLGTVADPGLVIVDGGSIDTWTNELRPRLEEIRRERELDRLLIDAVIVTSLEEKFAGGLIPLMREIDAQRDSKIFAIRQMAVPLFPDRFFNFAKHFLEEVKKNDCVYADVLFYGDIRKPIQMKSEGATIIFSRTFEIDSKNNYNALSRQQIFIEYESKKASIHVGDLSAFSVGGLENEARHLEHCDVHVFSDYWVGVSVMKDEMAGHDNYACIVSTNKILDDSIHRVIMQNSEHIFRPEVNVFGFVESPVALGSLMEKIPIHYPDFSNNLVYDVMAGRFLDRLPAYGAPLLREGSAELKFFRPPAPPFRNIDVLELAFLLTLDHRLDPEFLLHPMPSAFGRALTMGDRQVHRPEQIAELVRHLQQKHPNARPNPLWVAWMRETKKEAIATLTEALPDLLRGDGTPPVA